MVIVVMDLWTQKKSMVLGVLTAVGIFVGLVWVFNGDSDNSQAKNNGLPPVKLEDSDGDLVYGSLDSEKGLEVNSQSLAVLNEQLKEPEALVSLLKQYNPPLPEKRVEVYGGYGGAEDDLAWAKEEINNLIGDPLAILFLQKYFYPLDQVNEEDISHYYSPRADMSFVFDANNLLEKVCKGEKKCD